MKALILVADGVEDCELLYPLYRVREAGGEADIAGPGRTTYKGKHGYEIEADMTFADIEPDRYDLLILPGGKAPETVRLDANAIKAVKEMADAGKAIAAICHGTQILISAGLLKGKKATCWQGVRDDLKMAGADYSDEEVVVDGMLITSRCPDDLPAFCRAIFKAVTT